MDADFSHPVLKINELLKYITDYDVIIGSRYVSGGGISSNWTILRKFLSKFGNIIARKMLNLPVNDCTSGFRCYKTDVLKKIKYHELRSNGYALLIEIIYKLNINGFKIKEIPFLYTERTVGKSKISKKIAFEALLFVLKIAAFTMWNRLNNKFR
jgi:dolichol-phosphate mannosyltransferase